MELHENTFDHRRYAPSQKNIAPTPRKNGHRQGCDEARPRRPLEACGRIIAPALFAQRSFKEPRPGFLVLGDPQAPDCCCRPPALLEGSSRSWATCCQVRCGMQVAASCRCHHELLSLSLSLSLSPAPSSCYEWEAFSTDTNRFTLSTGLEPRHVP